MVNGLDLKLELAPAYAYPVRSSDVMTAVEIDEQKEEDMDEEGGRTVTKRPWTADEDNLLQKMVNLYGPRRWSVIASYFEGRMGKQCRERWVQHLQPSIKKGDWLEEEDKTIMEAVRTMGTKWNMIAKMLPGRTDNAVKNRYNSSMRKHMRHERQQLLQQVQFEAGGAMAETFKVRSPKRKPPTSPESSINSPGKRLRMLDETQNKEILRLSSKMVSTEQGTEARYQLGQQLINTLMREQYEYQNNISTMRRPEVSELEEPMELEEPDATHGAPAAWEPMEALPVGGGWGHLLEDVGQEVKEESASSHNTTTSGSGTTCQEEEEFIKFLSDDDGGRKRGAPSPRVGKALTKDPGPPPALGIVIRPGVSTRRSMAAAEAAAEAAAAEAANTANKTSVPERDHATFWDHLDADALPPVL